MKGCPVSARMCDAGGPFLLKGAGVLGHMLFIDCESRIDALILDLIWIGEAKNLIGEDSYFKKSMFTDKYNIHGKVFVHINLKVFP